MSSDVYSYCKLCQINHTQQRKHIYTKKHQKKLKWVLQKYGQKIKECRPYLSNPVIQEGDFESDKNFWCHCCGNSYKKHVSDYVKTILYGGVIEHLATEEHWANTETFFKENGADEKFKISFIVSEKDINLFKSKLEPLVDVYNHRAEKKTKALAKEIETQEHARKLVLESANVGSFASNKTESQYKTVKNKHGVVQNPTGYHDGIRVWRAGIVKYKQGSNQLKPLKYPCRKIERLDKCTESSIYTVSADGVGLTSITAKFDSRKGNIYTGATPPWLRDDAVEDKDKREAPSSSRIYGPSMEDLIKNKEAKRKAKLNPNRVGANFDHTVSQKDSEWLPSFGRVWNNGARWKSRHEYHNEQKSAKKTKKD